MVMKDLLLIIDMQNVYLPGQPWACPALPSVVRQIQRLLESPICGRDYDVVFTRHVVSEHPRGRWRFYNKNTRQISQDASFSQIIPPFQVSLNLWPCYEKSTYSACSIPKIMELLPFYKRILLSGVVAECCVLSTAEGLIDAGAQVVYLKDAIAGQTPEYEAMVCRLMERFIPVHTLVMTVEDYLACFKIHSTQPE